MPAVIDYYSNKITGDEFVGFVNGFVRKGERTGKVREGGPPFTRDEGRELSALAAKTSMKVKLRLKEINVD